MRVLEEERLSLAQVARLEGVHPGTVFRWIKSGLHGGRLKLESFKRGGRLFTTREALDRFYAKLSAANGSKATSIDPALEAEERFCDEQGL